MSSDDGERRGPLSGVRVADFSRVLAGPYATMMLADFGADVVKIESPTGDDTRAWTPPVDASGASTYFASVNRNKRSVVLDLSTDAGLAEAQRLAFSADVVVENFRPGVMERFGLSFDAVRAANPGVVYCSITGFGAGAGAALPGYDLLVQAVGGLMSVTGSPDGDPTKAGVALVDVLTGQNALAGILLALRARDAAGSGSAPGSGSGSLVQVDLLSSLLSGLVNQASSTLATGVAPQRMGNAHPSIAPYESFRAADRELVIAVGNDRQFAALAGVLEWPAGRVAPDEVGRVSRPVSSEANVGLENSATESADLDTRRADARRYSISGESTDLDTRRADARRYSTSGDERFASNPLRVTHRAELRALVEERLAGAPAADWVARLNAAGVPAGLVNDVGEALAFADALGLTPVVDVDGSRSVANPIRLAGAPAAYRSRPPRLGEHNGADWLAAFVTESSVAHAAPTEGIA